MSISQCPTSQLDMVCMLSDTAESRNFHCLTSVTILPFVKCRLCRRPAGWWRRQCAECRTLWQVWCLHRGAGMRALLAAFEATGISRANIERFLDAEPSKDGGSVRDQIAADVSNQLLQALGQRPERSAAEVKRLRARGQWRSYHERPPE